MGGAEAVGERPGLGGFFTAGDVAREHARECGDPVRDIGEGEGIVCQKEGMECDGAWAAWGLGCGRRGRGGGCDWLWKGWRGADDDGADLRRLDGHQPNGRCGGDGGGGVSGGDFWGRDGCAENHGPQGCLERGIDGGVDGGEQGAGD